ncbi:hypothetical protein JTB14_008454 [Gonioctena quinquepunctata]|nr:hypothetical protein JTB14_008454 [Gonioctena quinquepunctata]
MVILRNLKVPLRDEGLRGEAKLAVSGMITCPDNIDIVLKTSTNKREQHGHSDSPLKSCLLSGSHHQIIGLLRTSSESASSTRIGAETTYPLKLQWGGGMEMENGEFGRFFYLD